MKKVRFDLGNDQHDDLKGVAPMHSVVDQTELSKHTSCDDCWIAIHGKIYDVTGYLSKHPGGAQVMLKLAGKDATAPFDDVGHSLESLMFDLGPEACVGILEPALKTNNYSTSPSSEKKDAASTKRSKELLVEWQKSKTGFSGLIQPSETVIPALRRDPSEKFDLKDPEERLEAQKIASTITAIAAIAFCITVLLYVKLRCANMIDHVVGSAQADDNYEIPNWYT
ncbi:cytochrome b5-like heme/steroid binding domain-containing protein LALA0_S08e03070g [Lachancea lanzarotensis]|uniref:LALA0S08e03070g1_1 n=1 Tax=Lachancea lanzarotensis TaxID=1245769 RepID=A0A0C7N052_9SACH|nr:uncharacterized protein LALA0_S08e03070g [Lachancea lanzarotensis]CEP63464.1 LALA0S08e03070g1_1 [Lachancea lanzarotensis]